jgi:hypothetical protein
MFSSQEPAICQNVRDLKDAKGGYLKSVCTVYLQYNQADARATCKSNGMQLYTTNTAEDETAILDYADSQWPLNCLWVEGGDGNVCNILTNFNRTKFEKVGFPCTTSYYNFYCEYISKKPNHKVFKVTKVDCFS